MSDINDINAFSKKRRRRSFIIKLAVAAVLIAAGILIYINADTVFAPFKDIASKLNTTTSDEVGFPVKLPGSATYSFDTFSDGFLLLTDTYLYTYGTSGRQIYALKHGYSTAVQKSNDRRILLYDKGALDFSLYNKNERIFTKTLEDKIVYGSLSRSDYPAIVTASSRYSNILYVYDGTGEWKFTHMFVDENVMQVEFTEDSTALIVTAVSVANGDVVTNVYRFDLNSEENGVWKYTVPSGTLTFAIHTAKDSVCIIGDNTVFSLDIKTGELLGNYAISGTVACFDMSDDKTVLTLSSVSAGNMRMVSLNSASEPVADTDVSLNTSNVAIDGEIVYTLEGLVLGIYDKNLIRTSEKELSEEYTDFVKIGGSLFFLGYNEVARLGV